MLKEYKSGASYQGHIKDNRRTGRGVFTWPNGSKYEGEFTDNDRHGKGKRATCFKIDWGPCEVLPLRKGGLGVAETVCAILKADTKSFGGSFSFGGCKKFPPFERGGMTTFTLS